MRPICALNFGLTYEVRYALISLASRPSRYAVASRALTLAALTIGQAYRQSRTHLGHLAAGQSRQGTLTLKPLTLLVRALVKSSALIAVSGSTCETKELMLKVKEVHANVDFF